MNEITDFDADEVVPPLKQKSARFQVTTDRVLGFIGVMMAAGSAFLPWYVILNQDKFTLHAIRTVMTRDMPDLPARAVWNVSPMSIPNKDKSTIPSLPFDPIVTATTPGEQSGSQPPAALGEADGAEQAFPDRRFKLLHVSNGRALIQDDNGVYLVQVGSALPDNSKLATIEERDGKPVIITSDGSVIDQAQQ